ncbi:Coiled-coil domain-containing protein 58 [Desmophyllum pertusum]|uniref:Coiled-coil domain-containing protein 58 n=1 Tax=Desmophyllum pertusum TaxID=174260 RepID=A0A9X0CHD9_9CNID|nr:Coiled-coil domain-containing protein 58 [Desmophyllum pertusum]
MAAIEATLELALEAFNAEFVRNGYGSAPQGLMQLLRSQKVKEGESPSAARSRIYKRLWCLLWFGSGKSLGAGVGTQPTYVYPESLKEVVRRIVAGDLVDKPDPTHQSVYHVNIGDLAAAKWPAYKKK